MSGTVLVKIPFVKMSGTGNDFVMIDNRELRFDDAAKVAITQAVCPRATAIGADGAIFLEPAVDLPHVKKSGHHFRMRYYNADGSEAEMCGNGSRCISRFANSLGYAPVAMAFQTPAGTVRGEVLGATKNSVTEVKVRLSDPAPIVQHKNVSAGGKTLEVYFTNTGVPHACVFVEDVATFPIVEVGRALRYHDLFKPKGTNANFIQVLGPGRIRLRTYERGVEDETLACGTGSVASALCTAVKHGFTSPVKVDVQSGEQVRIEFTRQGEVFRDTYLIGNVKETFRGEFDWGV
ncbi:MAG: diaminopimelate epimerase [Planctomycetota bacterium]